MAGLGQLTRLRSLLKEKLDQDEEAPQIFQESVNLVDHVVDSQVSEWNLANSDSEQSNGQMGTDKNDSESIN